MRTVLTKNEINRLANQLLEKHAQKVHDLEIKVQELIRNYILENMVPADVTKFYKQNPAWLSTACTVKISMGAKGSEHFTLDKEVPWPENAPYPKITASKVKGLKAARSAYRGARTGYTKMLHETKAAIYSLRTRKKVLAEFPEAASIIGGETVKLTPAAPIDLKSLKAKISKA